MKPALPNWVRHHPEKYLKRLAFEVEMLAKAFPAFTFMTEGERLLVEGCFVTHSLNRYSVRIEYPDNYPYSAPTPCVIDHDVVDFCKEAPSHAFHHYGYRSELGGIVPCVMKSDGSSGQGWETKFSVVTILNLVAAWLHAYEVARTTGKWILPEA